MGDSHIHSSQCLDQLIFIAERLSHPGKVTVGLIGPVGLDGADLYSPAFKAIGPAQSLGQHFGSNEAVSGCQYLHSYASLSRRSSRICGHTGWIALRAALNTSCVRR